MHPGLANGLISGATWVNDIFMPEFRKPKQWCNYMLTHFGGSLSVGNIINRSTPWSVEDFHALYIACWIFFPVEKGSYMITLNDQQRANVKVGYNKLGLRKTSHLHGHGRSAGKGWAFLKGYTELLVQMEGGGKHSAEIDAHLFLKCEGHPAVSLGHALSYFEKLRKGHGAVANAALQNLARQQAALGLGTGPDLGLTERAAENYSKPYQELLKSMSLSGDTVTVQDAVVEMYNQCRQVTAPVNPTLQQAVAAAGLMAPMAESGLGGLDNDDVAKMIEQVLLPFAKAAAGTVGGQVKLAKVLNALVAAEPDLKTVAGHLKADAQRTGKSRSVRYFQEVVVSPHALDSAIDAAYQMLRV